MDCPDCNGPMWDNRGNKRNPKQPDYKCKDKDGCGKGVWEQKRNGSGGGSGNGNGQRASSGAGPRNSRPLTPLYLSCLQDGKAAVAHVFGKDATPELALNAAATLFIAATRDGSSLRAPKAKPAPPPPPPVQEEYEHDNAEADLPF